MNKKKLKKENEELREVNRAILAGIARGTELYEHFTEAENRELKKQIQKVVDITFQIALTAHDWKDFKEKSREEIAEWVANQLRQCGFPTKPMGSSWGVLEKIFN